MLNKMRINKGVTRMKKYERPVIELLSFDEEEVITASTQTQSYAAKDLNEYMFGDSVNAGSTTTVNIDRAIVTGN